MPKYGFNFQWMYSRPQDGPLPPDTRALDFMVENGFNFVRIPLSYWYWTTDFDYFNPDERILEHIDGYLSACHSRGLHVSLNLHRAPGYCINGNSLERHNLWQDQVAQDGFVFLWSHFAERYQHLSSDLLSFDLLNEPPAIGHYGMTRDLHATLIRRTVAEIRKISPEREIVINGLDGGNLAMPELADLKVIQSGRGYQPMAVSHFEASWFQGSSGLPPPIYPQTDWDGKTWNLETLREFYAPWRALEDKSIQVHIGEFGCYNKTPNDVALRWFKDLFQVFREMGWGYALWEFSGEFGIAEHGRPGTVYQDFQGYRIDRELLELMLESRALAERS